MVMGHERRSKSVQQQVACLLVASKPGGKSQSTGIGVK